MATQPRECPACGYERVRRTERMVDRSGFGAAPAGERWECGLCRFEWTSPAAGDLPPQLPRMT